MIVYLVHRLSYDHLYTYDARGRLASVSENGSVIDSYGYDGNGNRVSVNGQTIASYNADDQLTRYNGVAYTYAADGSLAGAGSTTYQYDALGHLLEVKTPTADITYTYDGLGRRVGKSINGTLVQGFLYADGIHPIAELDGQGNVVATFVYGTRPNVPDLMLKGGVTYRIVSDPLGSPVEVINTATGAIVEQISYDAWGNITIDTNPGFQPFGFAGGLYDADTGLVHFGARDYDPVIGRWTTRDPLGFASADTDLYAYVESDPVNAIDPTGLFSQQQLQNIIYNETASLSGLGIDQADVTIAYILQNRSNAGINGGVAPDTLSLEAQQAIRNGDAAAVEAYKRAAAAAARAIKCPHNDPTHGAKGYNLRKNSSTAPRFGNPADPVIMHFGPFNNSYPTVGNPNVPTLEQLPATGVYVDIYKW